MKKLKLDSWRGRLAADVAVSVATIALMAWQGAPGWAISLAVLVATRPSRFALAGDLENLRTRVQLFGLDGEEVQP